jgi:hypothetical protein
MTASTRDPEPKAQHPPDVVTPVVFIAPAAFTSLMQLTPIVMSFISLHEELADPITDMEVGLENYEVIFSDAFTRALTNTAVFALVRGHRHPLARSSRSSSMEAGPRQPRHSRSCSPLRHPHGGRRCCGRIRHLAVVRSTSC